MEIYVRLPEELQRIVTWYALCSPHKQSLVFENQRQFSCDMISGSQNVLICFNPLKERFNYFLDYNHRYITKEMSVTGDNFDVVVERNHRLLWYYYERLSNPMLVNFIKSNLNKHERNMICRRQFDKPFINLNIQELHWFKKYVFHTV
jgi:hypothetical protein